MPDDLHDRDILAWSAQQTELLRRAARGERVNGVDWDHVVEEIEDVGISELNAVRSYLRQMLVHLLKLRGWPNSQSVAQWRVEIAAFRRMRPSGSLPRCGKRSTSTSFTSARSSSSMAWILTAFNRLDGRPIARAHWNSSWRNGGLYWSNGSAQWHRAGGNRAFCLHRGQQ